MRRMLFGCAVGAFGLLALQSATAADMAYKAAPGFNWSGFYVGAQFGYGWSGVEIDDTAGAGTSFSTPPVWSASGFFGGLLAGINWQGMGSPLVLGIEADINLSGIAGTRDRLTQDNYSLDAAVDWFGSIRGRLGFAAGQSLFFVTGGWAWAGIEHGQTSPPTARGSGTATMDGWTIGGGIEYAWSSSSTIRVEYRHYAFGDATVTMPASYTSPRQFFMDMDTVSLGVALKF